MDGLVVTHIYLLMGCALPSTTSFTLFSGGLFNPEFTILSCAGCIFLGIGDVSAALYGRKFGRTYWQNGSKKTAEGSMACFVSIFIASLLLAKATSPLGTTLWICYVTASLVVTWVEALTGQYDNLVCTIVYFLALLQMIDSFN